MSDSSGRPLTRHRLRLAIAGASVTLVSALGSLGQAANIHLLSLAAYAVLIAGAGSVVWLTVRESHDENHQRRRDLLARLVTLDPDRVPQLRELSPYHLGTDPEAPGTGGVTSYLPRDIDTELDDAIACARRSVDPSMVIVRGPSKSGKSRSLYEAALRDQELREAYLLAPSDREVLRWVLDGPPDLPPGAVVLWLDDLERFVSGGHEGLDKASLETVRSWRRPVTVLATAGGKGAEQLADGLSVPIQQIYAHRRVAVVSLSSELTGAEGARVRARYNSEAAAEIIAHGIGEYLVAAPELARKLDEERHAPGDKPCPEGAAVAWAAIDWARSGMSGSIPDALLRDIWPLYLHGIEPTDERFARGLEWALRPAYRSVALVYQTSSYEAYDWIVAYANSRLSRDINTRAWERMMSVVDPRAAFDLAVAAYHKGSVPESTRAFERATQAEDARVAANSAFNLGYVLAEQGDVAGARAAYQAAIDSGVPELAAMAGLNLGILLQERRDVDGAADAYRAAGRQQASPHSGNAALNLGLLLSQLEDLDGASAALEAAASEGDCHVASTACFMLGSLLEKRAPVEAAQALGRAVELDDPDIAPAAAQLLGRMRNGSHETSESTEQSTLDLALRLDRGGDVAGAQRAYERVVASGEGELVPAAAFGLAVLLAERGDPDEARSAYETAIESGHPRIAPAAMLGLGSLLARRGDVAAARCVLARAAQAEQQDVAYAAAAALNELGDGSTEGR